MLDSNQKAFVFSFPSLHKQYIPELYWLKKKKKNLQFYSVLFKLKHIYKANIRTEGLLLSILRGILLEKELH